MSDDKATMTLNLTAREMAVVEELAASHDLSKTALIRQALRVYQMIQARIAAGETMTFSGDKERVAMFIGPGFEAQPTHSKQALADGDSNGTS